MNAANASQLAASVPVANLPQQQFENNLATAATTSRPLQIETFTSFPVNQAQKFDILLAHHLNSSDLIVTISSPILGLIDKQLDWVHGSQAANRCRVTFRAPIVGVYTINVELASQPQLAAQFQAKAYDLSKVFIIGSSGKCFLNESYEFSVDASEAGEGQLEIAVNEGEIPNQVQVLDNGKCIVDFLPEECVPHVVDIKFNGHNVNGCPFVVEVLQPGTATNSQQNGANQHQQVPSTNLILGKPILIKEERILVDSTVSFSLENIELKQSQQLKRDILIFDPQNQPITYNLTEDLKAGKYKFEFSPSVVGDYTVELRQKSGLFTLLPADLLEQFPFPLKVFDFSKVLVSDVSDGVIGHPIYFFIDASQAGSGNLEIRVSSKTRNVPNYPQSEANAKIRVNFTPTEAVDHSIDVKFNGIPVPGNPFLVKVAQYPQARFPIISQDLLKYVAVDEVVSFYIDYIGTKESGNILAKDLTERSCQVHVLRPDFIYTKLGNIELKPSEKDNQQMRFKVTFKPTKIGPYKIFATVNNELLPGSPIISNVYNINEVRVTFEETKIVNGKVEPCGQINKPVPFMVDASRAGEGTLALAVVSGANRNPVQADLKVSEKGHGLYNLTFLPSEFAPHSIDMSFNDRVVPSSPFVVDIHDANGQSSLLQEQRKKQSSSNGTSQIKSDQPQQDKDHQQLSQHQQMVQNFEVLNLNKQNSTPMKVSTSKLTSASSKSQVNQTNKKSLAFGLVNASNVVYLETGVLEGNKNQVSLTGPNNEKVPFIMAKGSPQPGEAKKPYIEYNPKSIGTHTISVLDGQTKELRHYFVEICDPSLIRITDLNSNDSFCAGKPITFCIDSRESGEIQLDSINIIGPKKSNGKVRDGDQTILGRIKSISSFSQNQSAPIEYSVSQLSYDKLEVRFVPPAAGKYSIDIRCLGQSVDCSPFEIDVRSANQHDQQLYGNPMSKQSAKQSSSSSSSGANTGTGVTTTTATNKEDELLQNIVVHGISLKCSPVNSTGAFIIETNRAAQARDFDVLITDPSRNLVDVQCYLQQDGNLLAEWTPKRVGTHKIEVLYKDQQVPGSPFMTEAFDPSGVIIENLKTTIYQVNDKIEFKLDRREAGFGELDVAITSPVGHDLPIEVRPIEPVSKEQATVGNSSSVEPLGEVVSFTPTVAGKYKMSIMFGGYEIPKSPITFIARDNREPIRASGAGLVCAEVNRSAQFTVESPSEGELKLRIECGEREIVPKVERRANLYTIKYKPNEIGYASISLYWNGAHLEGSPYSVPVNDLGKILFLSGTNKASNTNNQRIIDYEPRCAKEITVDTSKCGPGELKAEAYCRANPSIKFSIPADQYAANRYRLAFLCPPGVEQLAKGLNIRDIPLEATYLIRFYYNNLCVPETQASVVVSPIQVTTLNQKRESSLSRTKMQVDQLPENRSNRTIIMENNNNNSKPSLVNDDSSFGASNDDGVECPIVALRGHGLADAKCGEKAEFTIDGSGAGPGRPEVRFNGPSEEITVRLDQVQDKLYKATYVVQVPGVYSLNVLWDGKQIAGCPVSVNVLGGCDPNKVLCTGDGLKGGILGEEIKVFIDTRRAGPGELTALCTGPQKVAFCELLDRGDGTFFLYIKPQESGRQLLTIKYGGQHIPKSPFLIKVSGKPDPSKVRVYGPGVEHGVLSLYQSRFVCDTRGAGAGQLTVRIRGPKGAFRMETQRESQRDRTILCKYDPTEPGDYRIEIKWSGHHVPGSPFSVMIFDTQEELNRFLMGGQASLHPNKLAGPVLQHQVPYQPTMVEYGHYSSMTSQAQAQPPHRL